MATLTVQNIVRTGLEATYASASAGGDQFLNPTGDIILHVVNGLTDCVVTVVTQETVDGLAVADQTVTVTANEERIMGPYPPDYYNDSSGYVQITYDDESNVTIAALKVTI